MNVDIRPLKEEDAYISYKWRNDKEVFKLTGNTYQNEITIESELNWIKKVINNRNDARFAIIADNKYVGNIYLTDIKNKSAEYHIFIGDKDFWGKGVATKASFLIIDYGFNNLNLDTIKLEVREQNKAAINLYRKLGFKILEVGTEFIKMGLNKKDYSL